MESERMHLSIGETSKKKKLIYKQEKWTDVTNMWKMRTRARALHGAQELL